MRKALALAFFALCAAPMFASVQLDTSINDVFNRGSDELTGSITWTVNGDEFRDASTAEPVYIRVTPDHNSFLASTLVDQNHPTSSLLRQPIYLAMKLDGGNGLVNIAALPEAVSIVRWVAGESSFWIRVQQSSEEWLDASGVLVGPSVDREVSWTVGISARISDIANNQDAAVNDSNLPFNTRDSGAGETDYEEATSTLICVDLSSSNLFADGSTESLLNYDIITYDFRAETSPGVYSGQAGNILQIDYTNDFSIARGKSRACEVTVLTDPKAGDSAALLCIYRASSNGSTDEFVKLTNTLWFEIDCLAGGNYLDTDIVAGSSINFTTNGRGEYGFDDVAPLRFVDGENTGYTSVSGKFTNNGRNLWQNAVLYYNGDDESLNNGREFQIQVCLYTHYLDDPIEAIVDWDVTLLNHSGARDEAPYDGDDQYRRCAPSAYDLDGGEFVVGYFVACEGNPVSIFFPYLPIITGNTDFWVGLSYVNQGAVDLNIEAISYDEDGNRFSADLGSLATRNQKTWLLIEGADGISSLTGAGDNNEGQVALMTPDDPNLSTADFGTTRSSLFVRGTFPATYLDDVFNGDLDGYLLVGNASTLSIDGAYLPRNYDNDIPGQNADLPLWRQKAGAVKANKVVTEVQSSYRK